MTITSLTQKLDNLLIESKETNTKLDAERLQAAEARVLVAKQSNNINWLLGFAAPRPCF